MEKSIAEMTPGGLLKMHTVFYLYEEVREMQHCLFDERVVRSIEQRKAVAVRDASEKEGKMSGTWIMSDRQKNFSISNDL